MAKREAAGHEGYGEWRALELAIKDAVKKAARQAKARHRRGQHGRAGPAGRSRGFSPASSPKASSQSCCSRAE